MQRLAQLSFMIALGCQFLARPARPAEPSPGPPADGADVVESVNASESNAPARTPKEQRAANTKLALPAVTERGPVSSAPSPSLAGAEHFRLSAWARQRLELGLTRVRAELPARSVPHDALLSSSVLFAELEYLRSKGFAAVASGFVDYGVAARLRSTDPNLSSSVRAGSKK